MEKFEKKKETDAKRIAEGITL
jgi:alanine racemase